MFSRHCRQPSPCRRCGSQALWRQGRRRGAVQDMSREHTTRARGVCTVSSAPRVPSPARPPSAGLAGTCVDLGGHSGPVRRARQQRGVGVAPEGAFLRGPALLPHGRGCGVGQGLAREARLRCCMCHRPVTCARVPSSERPRRLGLAATMVVGAGPINTGCPMGRHMLANLHCALRKVLFHEPPKALSP